MNDFWVFGYGSIMWRPDIPHHAAHRARLDGYARRFWQGSEDHRGVPGAPGRVVTLVPQAGAHTWGMAYRVPGDRRESVLAYLDHREQGGYTRTLQPVSTHTPAGVATREAIVYVGRDTNPHWLGPSPLADMAAQIRRSVGPSGRNIDYLHALRDALRDLGLPDEHVEQLSAAAGIE